MCNRNDNKVKRKKEIKWCSKLVSMICSNFGVCVVILIYTSIGSLMFTTLEGGGGNKMIPAITKAGGFKSKMAAPPDGRRHTADHYSYSIVNSNLPVSANGVQRTEINLPASSPGLPAPNLAAPSSGGQRTLTNEQAVSGVLDSPSHRVNELKSDRSLKQADSNLDVVRNSRRISGQNSRNSLRKNDQLDAVSTAAVIFSAGVDVDSQQLRHQTVEKLWQITESLNILYRENWTRVVEKELRRYSQDLLRNLIRQHNLMTTDEAAASR